MLSLIDHTGLKFDKAAFKRECRKMIAYLEKRTGRAYGRVSLALVTAAEIKELNHRYLDKDGPTDVLSFNDDEDREKYSGDIALCTEVIRDNAMKDKKEFSAYLAEAVLHGLRHLGGFDHDYRNVSLQKIYKEQTAMLTEIKLDWSIFDV